MAGHARVIEAIERLRMYTLFASVPYTAMWARAISVQERDPTPALMVVAHGLGVLTVAVVSDRSDLERTGARGLALWKFPEGDDAREGDITLPLLALLTGVSFAGLIAAAPWFGLCATGLLLVGLWHATRPRARKYAMAEVLAPAGALLAPLAIVGAFAETALTHAEVGATMLGAVLLGLVVLLCVLRDRATDALRGWATTATRLGRSRTVAVAWAWIVAAVALGAMGAAWGWWGWLVSGSIALAAASSGGAFATGRWERLVAAWSIALWVVGAEFFVRAM